MTHPRSRPRETIEGFVFSAFWWSGEWEYLAEVVAAMRSASAFVEAETMKRGVPSTMRRAS